MATMTKQRSTGVNGVLAVPTEPIYRLTVEQYHRMIAADILDEDDPVELLDGWLVQKMPKNHPHTLATRRIRRALERVIPAGWEVDSQEPFTTETSEPEPDCMVFRESDEDRHPYPTEVGLAVEVADSTLRRDRTTKKTLYARASIPIYWIANLKHGQLEVFAEPTGPSPEPGYRRRRVYRGADVVTVLLANREIARIPVRELLP